MPKEARIKPIVLPQASFFSVIEKYILPSGKDSYKFFIYKNGAMGALPSLPNERSGCQRAGRRSQTVAKRQHLPHR
jgi:hypothetical protein